MEGSLNSPAGMGSSQPDSEKEGEAGHGSSGLSEKPGRPFSPLFLEEQCFSFDLILLKM